MSQTANDSLLSHNVPDGNYTSSSAAYTAQVGVSMGIAPVRGTFEDLGHWEQRLQHSNWLNSQK